MYCDISIYYYLLLLFCPFHLLQPSPTPGGPGRMYIFTSCSCLVTVTGNFKEIADQMKSKSLEYSLQNPLLSYLGLCAKDVLQADIHKDVLQADLLPLSCIASALQLQPTYGVSWRHVFHTLLPPWDLFLKRDLTPVSLVEFKLPTKKTYSHKTLRSYIRLEFLQLITNFYYSTREPDKGKYYELAITTKFNKIM